MKILWTYLKNYQGWITVALVLAGIAQILMLYDPVIFGKIIDGYTQINADETEEELIQGVLFWLGIAIAIALVAKMVMAFKDFVMRMVVQKFGMQIFNDGLRQTLRLPFTEFEDTSSGEILSILQKVRNDTERFISTAIIGPLQDLGSIVLSYREAEASLKIFNELMKKDREYRPENPVDIGEIEHLRFDRVTFRYRNAPTNALEDISFEASLGDTIAFVGPSGSGKSTLVKLLAGLYTPVKGEILYDGVSSREIRVNHMRRQLGFVTQETQLFSGTMRENMLFVKQDATDEEINTALEQASAVAIFDNTGQGLNTLLGEGGKKISGGEKQRLSIARALLRKPRILIFDEATSALDSITEDQITETVKGISALKQQITLLIAHRLSTIMHADTIYVLEKGRIVEQGSHNELVDRKGLYYAMWRQQIGERKPTVRILSASKPLIAESEIAGDILGETEE